MAVLRCNNGNKNAPISCSVIIGKETFDLFSDLKKEALNKVYFGIRAVLNRQTQVCSSFLERQIISSAWQNPISVYVNNSVAKFNCVNRWINYLLP